MAKVARTKVRRSTHKQAHDLAFPLSEVSVKISNGFPSLLEEEFSSNLWVGVPSYISRWPISRI